jgi:transposase-like protein
VLQGALLEEVESFLGRAQYGRGGEFSGYRNGYVPKRTIATRMAAVTVRQPRVSDVPEGREPFQFEIVSPWERRSRTKARLFARLYLVGLSGGDVEPIFRALVGETAALSPTSVLRLRQEWEDEYRLWGDVRCRSGTSTSSPTAPTRRRGRRRRRPRCWWS